MHIISMLSNLSNVFQFHLGSPKYQKLEGEERGPLTKGDGSNHEINSPRTFESPCVRKVNEISGKIGEMSSLFSSKPGCDQIQTACRQLLEILNPQKKIAPISSDNSLSPGVSLIKLQAIEGAIDNLLSSLKASCDPASRDPFADPQDEWNIEKQLNILELNLFKQDAEKFLGIRANIQHAFDTLSRRMERTESSRSFSADTPPVVSLFA